MATTADNLREAIERFVDIEARVKGVSKAEVWKQHPTLVERWRSAPTFERQILKSTSSAETVAERAAAQIDKAAHRLMWREFGKRREVSEAELKAELWSTDEGRALAAISRSKYGRLPWATVEGQIAKNDSWSLARQILSDGIQVG